MSLCYRGQDGELEINEEKGDRRKGTLSLDNRVGASQANATSKLLQQTRDGSRWTWKGGFQPHRGAVSCQEQLSHCLQTGLPLGYKCTPTEGGGENERLRRGPSFISELKGQNNYSVLFSIKKSFITELLMR